MVLEYKDALYFFEIKIVGEKENQDLIKLVYPLIYKKQLLYFRLTLMQ